LGERNKLWNEISGMNFQQLPWLIGGDFNTTRYTNEKAGGILSPSKCCLLLMILSMLAHFLILGVWEVYGAGTTKMPMGGK